MLYFVVSVVRLNNTNRHMDTDSNINKHTNKTKQKKFETQKRIESDEMKPGNEKRESTKRKGVTFADHLEIAVPPNINRQQSDKSSLLEGDQSPNGDDIFTPRTLELAQIYGTAKVKGSGVRKTVFGVTKILSFNKELIRYVKLG